MKKKARYVAILAVTLLLGGCAERMQPLIIGLITPLSGPMSDLGAGTTEGAQLALDDFLSDGKITINGRRRTVSLVEKDSSNHPEQAVRVAQQLIKQEGVVAIIGPPLSDLAVPVAGTCESAGVPMITQIATSRRVTAGRSCVFRVCYTDVSQGDAIARFSREQLGATTAAMLYDQANLFSRTVARIFAERFEAIGGSVAIDTTYTSDDRDVSDQLAEIAAIGPDVLFLPNYVNDLREQLPTVAAAGIEATIVGCDTMFFRNPEDRVLLNGAYFSGHYSNDVPTPMVRSFVSSYLREFDRQPTAVGALTYDALGLLFHAIERAENDSAGAICEAIREIGEYRGVTGVMKFDGSPDPEKSVIIIHVERGEFVFHTRIDP